MVREKSKLHVILVVNNTEIAGGTGVYVERLHKELLRDGISCSIATSITSLNRKVVRELSKNKKLYFMSMGFGVFSYIEQ